MLDIIHVDENEKMHHKVIPCLQKEFYTHIHGADEAFRLNWQLSTVTNHLRLQQTHLFLI